MSAPPEAGTRPLPRPSMKLTLPVNHNNRLQSKASPKETGFRSWPSFRLALTERFSADVSEHIEAQRALALRPITRGGVFPPIAPPPRQILTLISFKMSIMRSTGVRRAMRMNELEVPCRLLDWSEPLAPLGQRRHRSLAIDR